MDPRIHRRRVEVRREEGRHRLRVVVGIGAVVVVAGGGWAVTNSRALDVDHIVVEGAVHTPAQAAIAAASVRRGDRMADLDLGAAARGVRGLPWVGQARVERDWPGSVRIRLVERTAVAVIPAEEGGSALVDASGRVLARVDAPPPGLAVAVALPTELQARVVGVSPVAGTADEVELRLNAGSTVRLGPPQDLQRKFDAVRAVLAQVDMRNLAVLDVRRPDTPVLTRRDTPTKVSTPRAG